MQMADGVLSYVGIHNTLSEKRGIDVNNLL
jgi:hypothetical protein